MNKPGDDLLAAMLAGSRAAVARAISAVENEAPGARKLVSGVRTHLGRAHVIGITGAPGSGKSTLINALLGAYLSAGRKVAVVAVDPSSPLSGGAVLGDRIRMGEHGAHENCFIRSVSARGHLGGLSRTTGEIVDILDAAGFDVVIVETVGTGQSEVAIARLADTCVVLCPPGLGDEVQAIKAGVLEIADLLVVSKGDTALAERTERDLHEMLHLGRKRSEWAVRVLRVSAAAGDGIAQLMTEIAHHEQAAGRSRRLRPETTPSVAAAAALCQTLARRDRFATALGIELVAADAGTADVALTIGEDHLNFNGTCHGGVLFALADAAFGLASNSHGVVAAGIDAHITYNRAVRKGERLVAQAREVSRGKKLAVYRIDLSNADGACVATFTGTVFVTERHHHS